MEIDLNEQMVELQKAVQSLSKVLLDSSAEVQDLEVRGNLGAMVRQMNITAAEFVGSYGDIEKETDQMIAAAMCHTRNSHQGDSRPPQRIIPLRWGQIRDGLRFLSHLTTAPSQQQIKGTMRQWDGRPGWIERKTEAAATTRGKLKTAAARSTGPRSQDPDRRPSEIMVAIAGSVSGRSREKILR